MKKCVICNNNLDGNKRKFCSDKCKKKEHYQKGKNQRNSYHRQTIKGITRKVYLIEKSGNMCCSCGYDKNISALEFHHKDPSTKKFQIDLRNCSNRKLSDLELESEKCDLLCANCHREHHNPQMSKENIIELLK